MKLVGRIPVEPLDDERLTNIERRVVSGAADLAPRAARPGRRTLGFAAAAVMAIATGVVGWKLGAGTTSAPTVAEAAPIRITTEAERSSLAIGDATIVSDPMTAFVVTRPSGGVLVEMSRGRVELEVAKRANRPPLVVRAGDTDVIVVGTHFSVDYGDGTGDVDVRVTEGVVRVVRNQHEVRVAAGAAWKTQRGVIALADAGPPRASGRAAGSARGVTAASSAGATMAGPEGAGVSGETIAMGDDPSRTGSAGYQIDTGVAPDVLHHRTAQVPESAVPPAHRTSESAIAHPRPESGVRSNPPTARTATFDLQALVAEQPFEPAMDVGLDAMQAISRYREIAAKEKGDTASRAFYSVAVTQATKLGRTGDALQTLDMYLRRFAGGKEHTSALWLRVRILCGRAIDQMCRQAAYSYAHQAPDSPAHRLAERITIAE